MWKRAISGGGAACWRLTQRPLSTFAASSSAVSSVILRSLKDHYLEVSKMSPPPKISPPEPYTIVKGALDEEGPVLRREHKGEEITISVMRLADILPSGADDGEGDDAISQLFLHVDVSKPGSAESLHFLCGLYPDAVGIHSVRLRPTVSSLSSPGALSKYQGRVFQEMDQKMRDAFHLYIEERGVTESLFPFLQAWLYVKGHRNLMHWFKSVGTFITERKPT